MLKRSALSAILAVLAQMTQWFSKSLHLRVLVVKVFVLCK